MSNLVEKNSQELLSQTDITTKLVPDKDGFLFEVEDKTYPVGILCMAFTGVFFLLILLVIHDFNFFDIARGRLGTLVVFVSTPYLIYLFIKVYYYQKFQKKKVIKFYEKFIYIENKDIQIDIENIKKLYCLMFSAGSGEFILKSKVMVLMTFYFYPLAYLLLFISNYFLNKTTTIDNVFFLMQNKKLYGGIAYGSLNNKDKEKIQLYFKKYLRYHIGLLESKLIITSHI